MRPIRFNMSTKTVGMTKISRRLESIWETSSLRLLREWSSSVEQATQLERSRAFRMIGINGALTAFDKTTSSKWTS